MLARDGRRTMSSSTRSGVYQSDQYGVSANSSHQHAYPNRLSLQAHTGRTREERLRSSRRQSPQEVEDSRSKYRVNPSEDEQIEQRNDFAGGLERGVWTRNSSSEDAIGTFPSTHVHVQQTIPYQNPHPHIGTMPRAYVEDLPAEEVQRKTEFSRSQKKPSILNGQQHRQSHRPIEKNMNSYRSTRIGDSSSHEYENGSRSTNGYVEKAYHVHTRGDHDGLAQVRRGSGNGQRIERAVVDKGTSYSNSRSSVVEQQHPARAMRNKGRSDVSSQYQQQGRDNERKDNRYQNPGENYDATYATYGETLNEYNQTRGRDIYEDKLADTRLHTRRNVDVGKDKSKRCAHNAQRTLKNQSGMTERQREFTRSPNSYFLGPRHEDEYDLEKDPEVDDYRHAAVNGEVGETRVRWGKQDNDRLLPSVRAGRRGLDYDISQDKVYPPHSRYQAYDNKQVDNLIKDGRIFTRPMVDDEYSPPMRDAYRERDSMAGRIGERDVERHAVYASTSNVLHGAKSSIRHKKSNTNASANVPTTSTPMSSVRRTGGVPAYTPGSSIKQELARWRGQAGLKGIAAGEARAQLNFGGAIGPDDMNLDKPGDEQSHASVYEQVGHLFERVDDTELRENVTKMLLTKDLLARDLMDQLAANKVGNTSYNQLISKNKKIAILNGMIQTWEGKYAALQDELTNAEELKKENEELKVQLQEFADAIAVWQNHCEQQKLKFEDDLAEANGNDRGLEAEKHREELKIASCIEELEEFVNLCAKKGAGETPSEAVVLGLDNMKINASIQELTRIERIDRMRAEIERLRGLLNNVEGDDPSNGCAQQ
eukprot:CFRG0619T1